jgi:hypothetical protein
LTESTGKRIRNWALNGAVGVASLVVAFVMAEIVLRLIGFSNPVLWTYDDITGTRLYAGAEGWFRSEGEAYIKISSAGLRDREHTKGKSADTVRIAVLGDSMTEALQVPLERTYWSILERKLNDCEALAGKRVEVMNFGVSGYGTAQELLTFRHRTAAYSPDVTILAFYPGNDVRNNSKELEPNRLRPFFKLQDGKLVADQTFLASAGYASYKSNFDKRSWLFGLRSFQLLRQLRATLGQANEASASAAPGAGLEAGLDDEVFAPPKSPAWNDAWQVTERLIVAMRDEVEAAAGRFVVASIPTGIQVHPDPDARNRFITSLGIDDLWYPDTRLKALASRQNVDVITLAQRFQSYAERNRVYLHGFENTRLGTGHLNESGHKLVGEALAGYLCEAL